MKSLGFLRISNLESRIIGSTALLAVLLLSGCATRAMKGTPFYTGEYEVRRGSAEDRIAAWPLVYYREPALSVLWPFVELTEDHFAFRPVMSIYGLNKEKQVYNVAWPLGRFEADGDNRVFPLFWGDDYRTLFPLYWHAGQPLGEEGGSDMFIPLWYFRKDRRGYDAHIIWPFFNIRNYGEERGWRAWPLAGSYQDRDSRYRFFCWPIAHQWAHDKREDRATLIFPLCLLGSDSRSSGVISLPYSHMRYKDGSAWTLVPPVFFHRSDNERWAFVTPLYSLGRERKGDDAWDLLLPLGYRSREGDDRLFVTPLGGCRRKAGETSWVVPWVLTGGSAGKDEGGVWILGPMAHAQWARDSRSDHVFPLYARERDTEGSTFVSLLWSQQSATNGDGWQLAPPLFYRMKNGGRSAVVTPLYAWGASAKDEAKWSTLLPLYYRRIAKDDRLLVTLLGGIRHDADNRRWLVYPLLSGGRRGQDNGSLWLLGPLCHLEWDREASSHHVLPFYLWDGKTRTFVSPLGARWTSDRGRDVTLVPPLLTFCAKDEKRTDLWTAGGLAKLSWGEKPGSQYLLPLVYRDAEAGTFLSPVVCGWKQADGRQTTLAPIAASWMTRGEKRTDLWMLGPVSHFSWGPESGAHHVFPLYYRNPKDHTFVSPLVATWKERDVRKWIAPPLLSGGSSDGKTKELGLLLGLYAHRRSPDPEQCRTHLIPFFVHQKDKRFHTALFGWNKDEHDGYVYGPLGLGGVRRGDSTGWWVFPLASHRRHKKTGRVDGTFFWGNYWKHGRHTGSNMFPFYGYDNTGKLELADQQKKERYAVYGKDFWSLPACWYRHQVRVGPARGEEAEAGKRRTRTSIKEHGIFPLWSYSKEQRQDSAWQDVNGSLLWLLYDYEREIRPKTAKQPASDYTRSRVLWRLWHYERTDGDVAVDVFPFITWDKKQDGFKQFSFLWRLFRYRKSSEGTKVDALFILPLWRSGGKERGARREAPAARSEEQGKT